MRKSRKSDKISARRVELVRTLQNLSTEKRNPATSKIDTLSPLKIVRIINHEDKKVASVVAKALPSISRAARLYADTLRYGGRVIYIGAGTSGRLGVLDAAECPPTFGTDPKQIIGLISGGYDALTLSKEGAEDREDWAVADLKKISINRKDLVIGIAASVRTPYTIAGLKYARSVGAKTVLIVCNKGRFLKVRPEVLIELPVGPEAITGSTRMKSGTAQKMALNLISTTAMILLGKTYGNLMVDLQARSEKLAARSRKILMEFLGVDFTTADRLLAEAGGSVKTAIVMYRLSLDRKKADARLKKAGGFLRKLL